MAYRILIGISSRLEAFRASASAKLRELCFLLLAALEEVGDFNTSKKVGSSSYFL
jgi:hypothetical protein